MDPAGSISSQCFRKIDLMIKISFTRPIMYLVNRPSEIDPNKVFRERKIGKIAQKIP